MKRTARTIVIAASILLAIGLLGCSKPGASTQDAAIRNAEAAAGLEAALARAEEQRHAKDVPEIARTSHDAAIRRRAARALARIGDIQTADLLLQLLSDEDDEVAAWAAYGLGHACKTREEIHVKALAARAMGLGEKRANDAGTRGEQEIDARSAIARAIGRCGAPASEALLAAWVRARGSWSEPAAFALGDIAAKRGALTDDTLGALLDAADEGKGAPPTDAAIYPIGRLERVPDAFATRAIDVARGIVARASPARIFAVRALGRTTKDAVSVLVKIATDKAFLPAERAEAARSLALLGEAGQMGIAESLARVVPDKDPIAIAALGADEYGPMAALVGALGANPPDKSEPALVALAHLDAPGTPPESLVRRLASLRCGAALALAHAAYDSDVLAKCAAEGSEPWEKARLTALLRRPLVGDRRAAWRALAKSKNVRVREDAIEAVSIHAELGDVARPELTLAIASKHPGLVATAAAVVLAHPDRVLVLAERERKAALDPRAPPPTANPARETDRAFGKALEEALAFAWAEDLVETRANLVDAAVAVRAPGARAAAMAACHDPNATMRDRGAKALRALGEVAPVCAPPNDAPLATSESARAVSTGTRVVFQTDAGEAAIRFEPDLAPVSTARFVELARAGFFKGIEVHRVVPGFVVQLGDPDGDGYGGAGKLLRDEGSPVPFGALDVGVALAGRDTGSSQLFVTLARYPHLDGEYARIGRAEGDWAAIAQGDVVRDVRVED